MTQPVRAVLVPTPVGNPRVSPVSLALMLATAVVLLGADLDEKALLEREAALALAAEGRTWSGPVAEPPLTSGLGAPVVAAARASMAILGGEEAGVRASGAVAGALAVGAVYSLGTHLFVPSVGAVTGLLLLLFGSTRRFIGDVAGFEPWAVLFALIGLDAAWRMRDRRQAAVLAGLAAGAEVAIAGLPGLWLLVFVLVWLWVGKGLTPHSVATVTTSAGVAFVAILLPALSLSAEPIAQALANLLPQWWPNSPGSFLDLAPLFYPTVLGLVGLPRRVWRTSPMRFVQVWVGLALSSALLGGPAGPAVVGAVLPVVAIAVWGLQKASRRLAVGTVLLVLVSSMAVTSFRRTTVDGENVDRWAAREAARFVRNVLPGAPDIVATDHRIRARVALYAGRDISSWSSHGGLQPDVRFVVVERDAVRTRVDTSASDDWALQARLPPLAPLAEFGRWSIARTAPSTDRSKAPDSADGVPRVSPDFRPEG